MAETRLLLRGEKSPKICHGDLDKYEARILHLAPHTLANSKKSICPWSTPGCRASCLYYAGRGAGKYVAEARKRKTRWMHKDPKAFHYQLRRELSNLLTLAHKKGKLPVARLDGTSDLDLAMDFTTWFPQILFYDYTKSLKRYWEWLNNQNQEWYRNRYLTFSVSETTTHKEWTDVLKAGGTATVVFNRKKGEPLADGWTTCGQRFPIIDGDTHDFRFLDPPGVIVGLRAKGRARHDKTGFVV